MRRGREHIVSPPLALLIVLLLVLVGEIQLAQEPGKRAFPNTWTSHPEMGEHPFG